ncbi:MAG: PD-(D/E)XK nuclease family protein [Blastocatellia bacterium]
MARTVYLQNLGRRLAPPPGQVVVTPNRRAAEAMGVEWLTLDELASRLLGESGLKIASFITGQWVLREAIGDVYGGAEGTEMALRWREGIDALLREGVAPAQLATDESPRIRELARVAMAYRERLRRLALVDPAESLWQAAETDLSPCRLLVYGYFRPRRDELALIDRLAGDGSGIILPTGDSRFFSGHRELIAELRDRGWEALPAPQSLSQPESLEEPSEASFGWKVARSLLEGSGMGEMVSAFSEATVEAEVREVMRRVGEQLASGVAPEEMVLVAGDEESYSRSVLAVGREYGIPVRVSVEMPLAEHRPGSWIRLMMEMVGGGYGYEPTLRFRGHSLSPGLEASQLSEAARRRPFGLDGWREAGIEPWPLDWPVWPGQSERVPRSQLVRIIAAVLPLASSPTDASTRATEELVTGKLLNGLNDLVRMADESVTVERFAAEVIELLGALRQPALMEDRGIELLRPEMVSGGRFRHLFLLGMIEGEMPRPIREEVILDLYERKRLRGEGFPLATAVDLVRREMLSLIFALETATATVTISLPRLREGEPTLVAGFLRSAGLKIASLAGERVAAMSPEEARRIDPSAERAADPVSPHLRSALLVERSRELSPERDEYDGVTGRPVAIDQRRWSASQMTKFGQCRFRWFCRHILGVEEDAELPDEMGSRQYGRLFHRALELALADLPTGSNPRQWALSRIERALVEAESDPENPLHRFPAWPAQRMEWIDRLRRAIESEGFIDAAAEVIGREVKFEGTWHGLRVTGSIDRIDRTPDGITMIDYKTSSSFPKGANDGSGRLRLDLQLPLYIEAAGGDLFPGEEITGRYYSLTSLRDLVRRGEQPDEALAAFADRLHHQLATGDFAVEPDLAEEACGYCEFELVCRRGERLARKSSPTATGVEDEE